MDGESVEDLLGDLDELAEWLGDEQLGSELEDIQDFFQGEAAERYKQYANETYAESEEIALDLACKKAAKNLMYLDLYKGNSLHEPLRGRCHSTHALIWPGHPNGGLRVGKTMWAVCDCFGIHNASGKIIGRNNPHAVIPAIFSALLKYRPLDHVTLGRGRRLYDIRDAAPRYMMGF